MTRAGRIAGFAAGLLLAVPAPAAPGDCGKALPAEGRQQLQGPGYTAVVVPSLWPIPVGRHFSLQVQVCADPGKALPQTLRVDADMPARGTVRLALLAPPRAHFPQ